MNHSWLFLLLLPVAPAFADDAGAVRTGHELAENICAYCHVVDPGNVNPTVLYPPGPPFAEIANRGDWSLEALETFLRATHRDAKDPKGMSNPQLLDFQIEAIAAYVLSLRKAK